MTQIRISEASLGVHRLCVEFNSGYSLSIITGSGSHTSREEPYEIAVINTMGGLTDKLFDEGDMGGTVLGYLTAERVRYYVSKVAKFKNLT